MAEREKHPNDGMHPKRRAMRQENKGRLPDGAEYTATYDGVFRRWRGKLYILDKELKPVVFEDNSSGVWRLLEKLDDQYRKWCQENPDLK